MHDTTFATAVDFREQAVYYPQIRPGYTAWVSLFQFGNGDIGIAFNEVRKGENPDCVAPSLEFAEAMGIPYRFGPAAMGSMNRDLIYEYVYMKSSDNGKTWVQTGRCPVYTRHYWHVGYPDGRMVRIVGCQHYRYELGDERFHNDIEESTDGGNTWHKIAEVMEGGFFYCHKLKKLRDGSIVAAGNFSESFGPSTTKASRHTKVPGQCLTIDVCFVISRDGGHTWQGPHYVLPGVTAWEPDFVELADGSLLFINSTVQSGKPVYQVVRPTSGGFTNGPMMEIRRGKPVDDKVQSGITPESVTITPDGLIVGARRGDVYACSNDLGENWYEIAGAPNCHYQPIIELLPDGTFLTCWHYGADSALGEIDMYIGTHSFKLEERLPKPSKLNVERALSPDGSKYMNSYMATLTAGGKPVAGRAVRFRLEPVWREDGYDNTTRLEESNNVYEVVTDSNGVARLDLPEYDKCPDMHFGYWLDAIFEPEPGDDVAECRGPKVMHYAKRPARNNHANYPAYNNHGLIMLIPDSAARFPEMADVVRKIKAAGVDVSLEKWTESVGSEPRTKEILAFLTENNLVSLKPDGTYFWYRAVHCGDEPLHEVRVCETVEWYV